MSKLKHDIDRLNAGVCRFRPGRRCARIGAVLCLFALYTVAVAATVSDRLHEFGAVARGRMHAAFERAGVTYPPAHLMLVALKREARMDIYARNAGGPWHHVRAYPILAASGTQGPKLREGDGQVPEGLYRIELLNPNSRFHVSLRLDYPNAFDRSIAAADRRTRLGGDIMIHGSSVSVGCLAMGDRAAEDLFVAAADTGIEHVRVVIAPTDLRESTVSTGAMPRWITALYRDISSVLETLPPRNP